MRANRSGIPWHTIRHSVSRARDGGRAASAGGTLERGPARLRAELVHPAVALRRERAAGVRAARRRAVPALVLVLGDDTVEARSELRSRLLLGDVELVVTLGVVAHGLDCTLGAGRLPCAARRSRRARHGRETDIEDRKSRVAIPTDGRRWLSWPDDSPTITPAMRARVLEVFGEEYQR